MNFYFLHTKIIISLIFIITFAVFVFNFMRKLFNIIKGAISRVKVNKYLVAILVFLILTFCIGDSTLLKRYAYDQQINGLEKEIEYYKKLKDENTEKLNALQSDNESLEKFAREQFHMTKPDEELFIIIP